MTITHTQMISNTVVVPYLEHKHVFLLTAV